MKTWNLPYSDHRKLEKCLHSRKGKQGPEKLRKVSFVGIGNDLGITMGHNMDDFTLKKNCHLLIFMNPYYVCMIFFVIDLVDIQFLI